VIIVKRNFSAESFVKIKNKFKSKV